MLQLANYYPPPSPQTQVQLRRHPGAKACQLPSPRTQVQHQRTELKKKKIFALPSTPSKTVIDDDDDDDVDIKAIPKSYKTKLGEYHSSILG